MYLIYSCLIRGLIIYGVITGLLLCSSCEVYAQSDSNPFEIYASARITDLGGAAARNPFSIQRSDAMQNEDSTTGNLSNPFDMVSANRVGGSPKARKSQKKKTSEHPLVLYQNEQPVSAFWMMSLLLVMLTLLVSLFRMSLFRAYRAFTNDNYLKLLHRQQRGLLSVPYLLFYLFFLMNSGLFFFLGLQYFWSGVPATYGLLGSLVLGIGLVFLVKHLLLLLVKVIFGIQKVLGYYSFAIAIFNVLLGIALFPVNVLLIFGPPELHLPMIYCGGILMGAVYLYRYIRGLFLAREYLLFHKFHFFMYLCTVEIAPVMILVKILLSYRGVL